VNISERKSVVRLSLLAIPTAVLLTAVACGHRYNEELNDDLLSAVSNLDAERVAALLDSEISEPGALLQWMA